MSMETANWLNKTRAALIGERDTGVAYGDLPEIATHVTDALAEFAKPDDKPGDDYLYVQKGDGGEWFLCSWDSVQEAEEERDYEESDEEARENHVFPRIERLIDWLDAAQVKMQKEDEK